MAEPIDTEAIPEDEHDHIIGEAAKCGFRYNGTEFVLAGGLDSNELLNLMTGVPLPARYGPQWPRRTPGVTVGQALDAELYNTLTCAAFAIRCLKDGVDIGEKLPDALARINAMLSRGVKGGEVDRG